MTAKLARHKLLDEVYESLKGCGSRYLAVMLVQEAYLNECLRNLVFKTGTDEDAAIEVARRFRPIAAAPASVPALPKSKRGSRKAAALAEALAKRGLNLNGDRIAEAP